MKDKTYYAKSFSWGVITKVLDAAIKFITIPLLLNHFGKDDYGLLTLAIATNAYMQLLNMGINTGAIKFFSQWIGSGKRNLIDRVARTNITFYLVIGIVNSVILIFISIYGEHIFNITHFQFITFRQLLIVLAIVSTISWTTMVFNQLLIADEKIAFTQQVLSAKAILNLVLVLVTIYLKLSLLQYFITLSLLNTLVLIPYIYTTINRRLIQSFKPAFYWKDFSQILKYSLAIFAMGFFQYTAMQSRPIVLGIFSKESTAVLTEYRIIEVFPLFIISIGGILISIILPKASKAIEEDNQNAIKEIAYNGTRFSSIIVTFLCCPIILNAKNILELYVGAQYTELAPWLALWCITVLLFLHNSPVASLVLASGRTKMLVYSSAAACFISIVINAILCSTYGVGSAVIGYLVYIIIQLAFFYLYFNPYVLKINSIKIFKAFIKPTILGLVPVIIITTSNFNLDNLVIDIFLKMIIWFCTTISLMLLFKIIDIKDIYFNHIKTNN
ncbi:lipopolysaccharide biosynthesis protein [Saccharicrinis aurantiacus]|uniref:lipopolysaccharide biosynthesis protein n=1 Tax=Saccharicrinis aurantiacus TaxID=1849719 RepID=UPI00248FE854|nr:oligosaccharide flippase family protein [Saccharicrinis aurantiacus]